MKILMLSYLVFGDTIGGVENHILFISRELVKMGHEVEIAKPVWSEDKTDGVAAYENLKIHYINVGKRPKLLNLKLLNDIPFVKGFLSKILFLTRSRIICRHVLLHKPDIVWQHDFSSNWLSTYYISKFLPVILTNHTGEYLLLKKIPGFSSFENVFFKHYKAIIGPSADLTPRLSKAVTIHNGVDLSLFSFNGAKPSREDGIIRVFCPRRWAPTKGVRYFADSLAILDSSEHAKNIEVYFAGNDYDVYPSYVQEIQQRLSKIKNIKIILLGNLSVEKMAEIYRKSDIVIIPSLMEAVSLSALEAMASSCLVISTDVGGMPELINDGIDGYLIKSKDASALFEAISLAITQDDSRIISRGFAKATDLYSWKGIASRTMAFIRENL